MNKFPPPNYPDGYNQSFIPELDEEGNDIRRYLGIFLSNWYWFILAIFIAISLAYYINHYSEPAFTVTSSLLIQDDKNSAEMTSIDKMIPGGDIFKSQQTLQNEIGILKSYSLNLRVMDSLPDFQVVYVKVGRRGIAESRLFNDCPFTVNFNSLKDQQIGVPVNIEIISETQYKLKINDHQNITRELPFGKNFNEAGFNFTINLKDSAGFVLQEDITNRYKIWFEMPESLANAYRSKLGIEPMGKDATLVSLSSTGSSPAQEAEYLNKLMELYIQLGLDYKNQTADSTLKFIDNQLSYISDSLKVAETRLQKFRLSNKLIDLSTEGATIRNKLERYGTEKTNLTLQLKYYEYLSEYINSKNESGEIVSPSVMGISDPLLIKLVDELATLQLQKKQLSFNFAGEPPSIVLIEGKIKDARYSLEENIKNSVKNINIALSDVSERIALVDTDVSKLPGTERELITIQRIFDLNNTVYVYMLEKRSEAGIAKASRVSSNRIIDRAEPFNSVKIRPRERRNILIALMLGFLLPAIYIYLADRLNDKILDKKDIAKGTEVPVIGFIGHSDNKYELPVFSNPGSALSESFRSIRTSLKYFNPGDKKSIITVTSTISGEGKTFISTNLAVVYALLGKRTLIAGLDLRKPRIHKIFNTPDNTGVSTFLIGESKFEDIIYKTEINNLFFAPSGPVPPNPAELIESDRMKQFIEDARKEFDIIILDTPPLGIVTDAMLLGVHSDVNLFVIRQRYSSKNTLELIQSIYEKKDIRNPAIIINDINLSGYYGYGIRYGGGMYSGYGYDYGYGRYGKYNYGSSSNYYTKE